MRSLLFSFFFLFSFLNNAQTTYYFSSSLGDDSNTGTSENNPFKTIAKLNALQLNPGDKVLFKKGDIFIGQILISYSGIENAPIIFNSYGNGTLPILSGSDGDNAIADPLSTIDIKDKSYLEFKNLHIRNERFNAKQGVDNDKSFGILITSSKTLPSSGNFEDRQLSKHFRFSNLMFDKIYSLSSANTEFNQIRTSAIYFEDAFVNDVIIEDNYFTDLERVGVWMRRYTSDVIIRNNAFIDIGGSGAIISVSKRVLYENNLMRFTGSNADARMTARGSGMWVFGSDDVVAQYNISQHARGNGDSSGMHVDYGNTNILFQYNYLEDSAGGFCETLGDNVNVIWRYNVSVNEGTDEGGGKNKLLWVNDYAFNPKKSEQVFIYNNTIYQGRDYKNVLGDSRIELKATDISFLNNIIFLENSTKLGIKSYLFDVNSPNFKKNVMFGGTINTNFKNKDATRREINPRFLDGGRRHFTGYKLMSYSSVKGDAFNFTEPIFPLAGSGVFANVTSKAEKDIFGNPVNLTGATNIGAYNGSGEQVTTTVFTFEAEDALIDGGSSINCTNASGARAVNFQGDGQSVSFSAINVSEAGSYVLRIYYVNGVKSKIKMKVNTNQFQELILPATNGYCFEAGTATEFSTLVQLNAGTNSIRFENGILDKIEMVYVEKGTLNTKTLVQEFGYYSLNKTVFTTDDRIELKSSLSKLPSDIKVVIYDIKGSQLFASNYKDLHFSIPTSRLGRGVRLLMAKLDDKLFVEKIIIQ